MIKPIWSGITQTCFLKHTTTTNFISLHSAVKPYCLGKHIQPHTLMPDVHIHVHTHLHTDTHTGCHTHRDVYVCMKTHTPVHRGTHTCICIDTQASSVSNHQFLFLFSCSTDETPLASSHLSWDSPHQSVQPCFPLLFFIFSLHYRRSVFGAKHLF